MKNNKLYLTLIIVICLICVIFGLNYLLMYLVFNRNLPGPPDNKIKVINWETKYTSEEHVERIEKLIFDNVGEVEVLYEYSDYKHNDYMKNGEFKISECEVNIVYGFDETPSYFVADLKYVINGLDKDDNEYYEWETYTIGFILDDKYYIKEWAYNEYGYVFHVESYFAERAVYTSSPYKRLNVLDKKLYYANYGYYVYESDGVLYETHYIGTSLSNVRIISENENFGINYVNYRDGTWKLLS